MGQVRPGTLSLPLGRIPKGPRGPGNRHSCACLLVLPQRRALPDRKVTTCAPSWSPGPAAPGLAHLQHHLHSSSISLVLPLPLMARISRPPKTSPVRTLLLLPWRTQATPGPTASPSVSSSCTASIRTCLLSPVTASHAHRTHRANLRNGMEQ